MTYNLYFVDRRFTTGIMPALPPTPADELLVSATTGTGARAATAAGDSAGDAAVEGSGIPTGAASAAEDLRQRRGASATKEEG